MFRYVALHHDRKHISRSLERQRRIAHRSVPFAYDYGLAFAEDEADYDQEINEIAHTLISEGERFYSPLLPAEPLDEKAGTVRFRSDITTSDENNNTFECIVSDSGSRDHALLVFHHWYARQRYTAFAKFFASRGITVVEATLPYHFGRGTDDVSEEQFFSASLGRTVRSMRQAVLDGRKIVRWLDGLGYKKISAVGMCLGGTVAGLVAAQEDKLGKAALMVTPADPADLVWTAETMKTLRSRIEPAVSHEALKTAWSLISLEKHLWSLTRPDLHLMFVIGKNDTIARPEGLDRLIDDLTRCNRQPEVLRLSCGHSSVGVFPYNIIAAKKVLNFLTDAAR